MDHNNNGSNGLYGASYGGYPAAGSSYAGSYGDGNPYTPSSPGGTSNTASSLASLRKRGGTGLVSDSPLSRVGSGGGGGGGSSSHHRRPPPAVVKSLDFMFPKVEQEFTVQTQRGGIASLIAYGLVALLALTEFLTWRAQNRALKEHIYVDTSLGKRLRININVTFPALSCVDLHVDAMDVAGDSQIDIEETMIKKQLHMDGSPLSLEEIKVETNAHRVEQEKKQRILKEQLPENYCGPCFGAHEKEGQCCQTCDDVLEAYKKKRWRSDVLVYTAEQCVREGRDKKEPKRMSKGQGCNLSGYMVVNRVAGNFHIAMGEGIERDGRHIHTYVPDDSPNFNASHIIHHLSFGPVVDKGAPLNGVTKIVTEQHGTTGLFQYFIKVVPTTYRGKEVFPPQLPTPKAASAASAADSTASETVQDDPDVLETNRYFFTERFRPLMTEYLEDHHMEKDESGKAGVHAGTGGSHGNQDHHKIQNAVLPGVFFIYEIYPFAMEVSKNSVPFTHLLIRLMATVGGVFTVMRWAGTWLS